MSERAPTGSPRTCSGDMYPAVPITIPGWESAMVAVLSAGLATFCLASPKSRIFTRPPRVSMTFSGLRSR